MNNLANELNHELEGTVASRLLSRLGQRLYFPRGIIAQSAEAKKAAYLANATIGMAFSKGKPLIMSAVADSFPTLKAEEIVTYAPTAGMETARIRWQDLLLQKNPSIKKDSISLPVVAPGLTAGISYTADLFMDEDTEVLASGPCWDNYGFIIRERRGASLKEIPFFKHVVSVNEKPGLDLDSICRAMREEAKTGAVRIMLNFPNNPSGYSPTNAEAAALLTIIREAADSGADVLVICDDAYFGLFYEDDIHDESLFAPLCSLHERVLAVKIDGPTKEDYAWGLRMGFITLGSKGLHAQHYDALIKKYMGAIRSSVSCANTPAQYLMLKTIEDPRTAGEKERYYNMMRARYHAVKRFIAENPNHPVLDPLPFNSGYFMSFHCTGVGAEALRQELLAKHGIGAIALEEQYLRIAFSSIDEEQIPEIYRIIYDTAAGMK